MLYFVIGFVAGVSCMTYKQTIEKKLHKLRRLNKFCSAVEKHPVWSLWLRIQILSKVVLGGIDTTKNTVTKLDRKRYEVTYHIDKRRYKMVVTHRKGPPMFKEVFNDKGENIKDLICQYIGPSQDWHNTEYKPSFFGSEKVTFILPDGTPKICDEILKIN